MHSAYRVFAVTFAACLLVQGWVSQSHFTLDHYNVWVDGVKLYAAGNPSAHRYPIHLYPATTIFLPAGALAAAGVPADMAFRVTMTFLVSLAGALTAAVAFLLRPQSLWWVFVAWLSVFHTLYVVATPPSSLASLLAALYALLILVARERTALSLPMLAAIGVCGGIMLATRLDVSGVFVAAGALYLAWKRPAAWYVMPLAAAAVFLLCAPHIIAAPLEQISRLVESMMLVAQKTGHGKHTASVPYVSVFGGAALLLAGLLLAMRRLRTLPGDFAIFLMIVSLSITLVLLQTRHHPQWLFYPAYFIWQLLLPLLVIDGLRSLPETNALRVLLRPGTSGTALALAYMLCQCWIFYFQLAE